MGWVWDSSKRMKWYTNESRKILNRRKSTSSPNVPIWNASRLNSYTEKSSIRFTLQSIWKETIALPFNSFIFSSSDASIIWVPSRTSSREGTRIRIWSVTWMTKSSLFTIKLDQNSWSSVINWLRHKVKFSQLWVISSGKKWTRIIFQKRTIS